MAMIYLILFCDLFLNVTKWKYTNKERVSSKYGKTTVAVTSMDCDFGVEFCTFTAINICDAIIEPIILPCSTLCVLQC